MFGIRWNEDVLPTGTGEISVAQFPRPDSPAPRPLYAFALPDGNFFLDPLVRPVARVLRMVFRIKYFYYGKNQYNIFTKNLLCVLKTS